jgi:Fe-S oxidoreductase
LPADAGKALKTMEAQGNPFGSQAERMDLVEKLAIPVLKEGQETDVLFWIGCCTTFDPQKHQIAEDMVAVMRAAGVSCAHLGKEEGCCGDPARVLGDENLFQMTAKANVAALQARRFRHLLVICPHGFNVFKNEYPQFGAELPVIHHSQLLAQWIREGRIKLTRPVPEKVTFHDPCYLGRYQGIYAAPRELLRTIPGLELREMASHHERSFCCGAGGGHYWMDLDQGEGRTYTHRVDEAQAAGAGTIAVGCSFCYQMLLDGTKARNLDETLKIKDIVSLVRESMES